MVLLVSGAAAMETGAAYEVTDRDRAKDASDLPAHPS
jgi:hypothetical protein